MEADSLFEFFADVIEDTLYIGSSPDDLEQEIKENTWHLSKRVNETASTRDYLMLINRIIENRKHQIASSNRGVGMIFYLWFDEQACQLRFSLINDGHTFLPFNTNIEITPVLHHIMGAFWTSDCHGGIPFDQLEEVSVEDYTNDPTPHSSNILWVYKQHL